MGPGISSPVGCNDHAPNINPHNSIYRSKQNPLRDQWMASPGSSVSAGLVDMSQYTSQLYKILSCSTRKSPGVLKNPSLVHKTVWPSKIHMASGACLAIQHHPQFTEWPKDLKPTFVPSHEKFDSYVRLHCSNCQFSQGSLPRLSPNCASRTHCIVFLWAQLCKGSRP